MINNINCDPFDEYFLPEEIQEEVLSFLQLNDFKNATLVSKKWNEKISATRAFAKKVGISIKTTEYPKLSSLRKYENIKIRQFELKSSLKYFLENNQWKFVFLNFSKVSSQEKFVYVIKRLKHVKELKVYNVLITKLKKHEKLSFQHLENLIFSDVALDLLEIFLAKQPSLIGLSLAYINCDILHPIGVRKTLIELLNFNNHLRELYLNYDVTNVLFQEEINSLTSLNLTNLSIGFDSKNDVANSHARLNIEYFLKSQKELRVLQMSFQQKILTSTRSRRELHWFLRDEFERSNLQEATDISILFNVWNEMDMLIHLTLRFVENCTFDQFDMKIVKNCRPNLIIKTVEIKHMNRSYPHLIIEALLKLTPNLHTLYVSKLTRIWIDFASKNLIFLKKIKYCAIEEDLNCKEYYELKTRTEGGNCNIVFQQSYLG
jgi:hypothetical protein